VDDHQSYDIVGGFRDNFKLQISYFSFDSKSMF